jgi:hypothetical protein
MAIASSLVRTARIWRGELNRLRLPSAARAEHNRDVRSGLGADPGIDRSVEAAVAWLCRAQDRSSTADGGFARHFSLISGWGASYPETTGYIIPTLIERAKATRSEDLRARAKRALDWLVSIQLPDGGFQGGTVDLKPVVSVTFNTGQILMGLAAGVREFGADYDAPMRRAADWLVATQDKDGCWRSHHSPFAGPGDKTYDTHVAWGLLEAARVHPDRGYAESALRNIRWAISLQQPNGWMSHCCLSDPTQPLTHTLGYALRGIVEGYLFSWERDLLEAGLRLGRGLLTAKSDGGFLPGRLDAHWGAAVTWACLTGSVQIAHSWLLLYKETGEEAFNHGAREVNRYVRSTIAIDGSADVKGGVKGAFPVSGDYGDYQYLNWAAKFFIGSNVLEQQTAS